mmetsp:Transcript_2379/g.4932  ORF Transcript_2379/g.4932 Transcript_2379/m.4932 type:complete len:268 (+) Transcript_2379:998-1801(+)
MHEDFAWGICRGARARLPLQGERQRSFDYQKPQAGPRGEELPQLHASFHVHSHPLLPQRRHHQRHLPPRQPRLPKEGLQLGQVLCHRRSRLHPPGPRRGGHGTPRPLPSSGGRHDRPRVRILRGRGPHGPWSHPCQAKLPLREETLDHGVPQAAAQKLLHERDHRTWSRDRSRSRRPRLQGPCHIQRAQGRPLLRLSCSRGGSRPCHGHGYARQRWGGGRQRDRDARIREGHHSRENHPRTQPRNCHHALRARERGGRYHRAALPRP